MLRKKFGKKDAKKPVQSTTTQPAKTESKVQSKQTTEQAAKQTEEEVLELKIKEIEKLAGKQFTKEQMTDALKSNNMEPKTSLKHLLNQKKEEKNLQNALLYNKAKQNTNNINIQASTQDNNNKSKQQEDQTKKLTEEFDNIFIAQNLVDKMQIMKQKQLKPFKMSVPVDLLDQIKANFEKPSPDSIILKQLEQQQKKKLSY